MKKLLIIVLVIAFSTVPCTQSPNTTEPRAGDFPLVGKYDVLTETVAGDFPLVGLTDNCLAA